MNKEVHQLTSILCFFLFSFSLTAQVQWTDVEQTAFEPVGKRVIHAKDYRLLEVDFNQLKSSMWQAPMETSAGTPQRFDVPMPDGTTLTFDIVESPIAAKEFLTRFPEIKTFAGTVAGEPGIYGRFDVTPQGFHAMIMRAGKSTIYIDPFTHGGGDVSHYMSYDRSQFTTDKVFSCGVESRDNTPEDYVAPSIRAPYANCTQKRYRLAITATGEYTSYHGGITGAAAAQVTTMNRVNGVYGRDLAIQMIIIGNNADIIYSNASTDPFNGTSASSMIGQNQTNTDAVIGSANYDIGHIFSTGGSGLASLNSVCGGSKARGVTGIAQPVGDPFDIDYVSHEMGHQFGGTHTQNNSCNRTNSTAVEPGSASTIMGYAGICSPNVQNNSDDHFHGANLFQMGNFIDGSGGSCAQIISIGNSPPVVNSYSNNTTIPGGTPFVLSADVSDANGDELTYCWEQMDTQVATMPPTSTATGGPSFRSNSPSLSPSRYFPALSNVIAGTSTSWEVLSTVDRSYSFRLSVRDNTSQGSCTEYVDANFNVDGDSGPFVTLSPNSQGITWNAGSAQTVIWDVAGTSSAPVSCASVNIKLSVDGGLTYPYLLLNGTSNDGSENVIVPNVVTTEARIMVEAADNVFYDISNNDFTIVSQLESPCVGGMAGIYPCDGYDLVSTVDMTDLGMPNTVEANDIWGWTDPMDGKEYAILGLTNGTSFIDISDANSPVVLGRLPTHTGNSPWRDIKVYQNHAFIVSEAAGHGMQVFDLTRLRNVSSPPETFTEDAHYDGFGDAHNIVIDEESAYAYAVGTDFFSGGLQFINIQNPTSPVAAGGFAEDGYTHDAQVTVYNGPDADYQGKQIAFCSNTDSFTIVDVQDKTDPQQISRTTYPNTGYAHQGWLTEDQRYFLMNDELDESQQGNNTRTLLWDALDLDAPVFMGVYENPNTLAIDHNMYTHNGLLYQANYKAGLRVLDLANVAAGELEEVGYFDVFPADDNPSFNGAWSNYPYFASGNIIVSSIENGLFIVAPSPDAPCEQPSGLTVSGLSSNAVTVSWSGSANTDSYDVEVVPSGTSPTGSPTASGIQLTQYTYAPPASGVTYDFYVRANCGATNLSQYIGPTSATVPTDFCAIGEYVDGGGISGEYDNNLDETTVICPNEPGQIQVAFISFDVEDRSNGRCWDELFIYDGPDVGSTPVSPADLGVGTEIDGGFCYDPSASNGTGDLAGQTITSTHPSGCLTFRFETDGSVTEPGWVAQVICPMEEIACPGDFNGDLLINVEDFIILNSAFGSSCDGCLEDISGDGVVNVTDFTAFNSFFGANCSASPGIANPTSHSLGTVHSELFEAASTMNLHPALRKAMDEMSLSADLRVYPNPTNGDQIIVRLDGSKHVTLAVADLTGKTIWQSGIGPQSAGVDFVIDFNQRLARGSYVLIEQSASGVRTGRFVVD